MQIALNRLRAWITPDQAVKRESYVGGIQLHLSLYTMQEMAARVVVDDSGQVEGVVWASVGSDRDGMMTHTRLRRVDCRNVGDLIVNMSICSWTERAAYRQSQLSS